jgi:hypothetical protein
MTDTLPKVSGDTKAIKVAGARVLGTTKDGVRILKPRGRATHFKGKELRTIIARVIAAKPVE